MSMIAGVKANGSPRTLAGATINGGFLNFHAVGGSSLAGPMWAKAMRVIQNYLPPAQFDIPPRRKPAPPPKKEEDDEPSNDGGGNNGGGTDGNGNNGGGGGTDGDQG
jgi:hypothetical protein